MIRQLSEQLQQSLLAQPESGMGYQWVEATHLDGRKEELLALNATFLAKDLAEVRAVTGGTRVLFEKRLQLAARETEMSVPPSIRSLSVVRPALAVREANHKGPASTAPETETQPSSEYRRFSAFENDRRVTADGGLVAGTYVTTAADADTYVRTGEDAVKRYALPNPTPACYEFVIRPPVKTRIKEGTAQPAYGQPGGGVEVIFVVGSPAKTVTKGRTLPER